TIGLRMVMTPTWARAASSPAIAVSRVAIAVSAPGMVLRNAPTVRQRRWRLRVAAVIWPPTWIPPAPERTGTGIPGRMPVRPALLCSRVQPPIFLVSAIPAGTVRWPTASVRDRAVCPVAAPGSGGPDRTEEVVHRVAALSRLRLPSWTGGLPPLAGVGGG